MHTLGELLQSALTVLLVRFVCGLHSSSQIVLSYTLPTFSEIYSA